MKVDFEQWMKIVFPSVLEKGDYVTRKDARGGKVKAYVDWKGLQRSIYHDLYYIATTSAKSTPSFFKEED